MQFSDHDNLKFDLEVDSGETQYPVAAVLNVKRMDYEEVLHIIGFGKVQWILLFMSGLMTLSSMATQTSISIIAISSQCEFGISQAEKGIMMAMCVAGVFLSTYFWGYVSDVLGRRAVLLYGMLSTNILQLLTIVVSNFWLFNVINFVMGICLGAVSAAIYAFISEFTSLKYRAIMVNYCSMFVSIAAIYVPATSWWVLSHDWSFSISEAFVLRPWRLIILMSLLPGLVAVLMIIFFPESPKFLIAQSRDNHALAAVEWIAQQNRGMPLVHVLQVDNASLILENSAEEGALFESTGLWNILASIWRSTVPVFQKPHLRGFLLSAVTMFALFFSSAGIQNWFPEIVNRSSTNKSSNSSTVCEILDESFAIQSSANLNTTAMCTNTISTQTYIDNMIVGFAFLLGFLIQGALLQPLGRKNVLMAAVLISTCCGLLLLFVTNATAILVLFCLFIMLPGLSISTMCGTVVDLVPTKLRGTAVSICLTFGRLAVILATYLIGLTLEPFCNSSFLLLAASLFICIFLIHFLPIKYKA